SLGGKAKLIYLSEDGFQDIIDFAPTGLFWRAYPGLIERSELILKLSNLKIPQIPSFESLFISGDKSFLTTLSDKDDINAVLKAGDSAAGLEIIIGKNFKNSWEDKLKEVMNSDKEWNSGFMSRNSDNEIVNVHQGGFYQSVILKHDN
ncbi:6965_t:CDS:2, partial [Gigaspora rosea]